MLHLQVTLVQENGGQEALLGSDYEYQPTLKYWTSWGSTRITRESAPLSTVNPVSLDAIPLPPADITRVRGDERVWFEMQALSRYSGIGSIDEQEKKRQVYQVHAGQAKIALTELLQTHTHNPGYATVELPMVDPQLTLAKMGELSNSEEGKKLSESQREAAALTAAYKGRILVSFSFSRDVSSPHLLNTLLHASRLEHPGKLMYDSPTMVNAMQRMQTRLLTAYSNAFFGKFTPDGKPAGPPTYALGPETSLDHMHLPLMTSAQGVMAPIALSQHRAETRESVHLTAQEARMYGPTPAAARVMEKSIVSAALRAGITRDAFVSAVRSQHTQSASDPSISAAYLKAETVVVKVGTGRGNSLHYMMDLRYPNKATLTQEQRDFLNKSDSAISTPTLSPNPGYGGTVCRTLLASTRVYRTPGLGRQWQYLVGRRRKTCVMIGATEATTPEKVAAMPALSLEIESMDPDGLQMRMRNDDCEGSAQVSMDAIRQIPALAACVTREECPALHAAADICRLRLPCEAVMSVSAAFVDTSGAKLSKEALKEMHDLPMIGDSQDTHREVGGHCPGLWVTKTDVAAGLIRGGCDLKRELPKLARHLETATAWEKRLPTHIPEGTASTESLVLPAGEVAQAVMPTGGDAQLYEQQAALKKSFQKSLLPTRDDGIKSPLIEHTHSEGLAYYSAIQALERRISSFYMGLSHFTCADVYAENPLYGQLSVVNPSDMTRGGEIGEVLRLPWTPNPKLAYVPTFGEIPRAEWDRDFRPVMAAIQNQLPLASVDFYPDHDTEEAASMRVGCLLSAQLLSRGFSQSPLPVGTVLERYVKGRQMQEKLNTPKLGLAQQPTPNPGYANSPNPGAAVVLPFTIQSWILKEPGAMDAVIQALKEKVALGEVVSYKFISDRPLPHGDDVVTAIVELANPAKEEDNNIPITRVWGGVEELQSVAFMGQNFLETADLRMSYVKFQRRVGILFPALYNLVGPPLEQIRQNTRQVQSYLRALVLSVDAKLRTSKEWVTAAALTTFGNEIAVEQRRDAPNGDSFSYMLWRCLDPAYRRYWSKDVIPTPRKE